MLNPGFAAIGIARVYNANSMYGWYWTTDFGGYVDQPLSPAPSPTPASAPVITSFVASSTAITAGQSTTLTWNTTGATDVTIDNGVGDVSQLTSKVVSPAQTTTYTLTASNSALSVSATVTVTVAAARGTQAPSAPTLKSASAASPTEIDLSWSASTGGTGIAGYEVVRNGAVIANVPATSLAYADTTVTGSSTYAYAVAAYDQAGNISALSNTVQATTPASPVSTTCAAPATGAFTGCYYNNITLTGTPALTRTDSQINFDWTWSSPDPAVNYSDFSVRWQGYFTFNPGPYTFTAITSDGMRVYIDGVLVFDSWRNQPTNVYTFGQDLTQGQHLLTVEYYDHTDSASAHLSWQAGSLTGRSGR